MTTLRFKPFAVGIDPGLAKPHRIAWQRPDDDGAPWALYECMPPDGDLKASASRQGKSGAGVVVGVEARGDRRAVRILDCLNRAWEDGMRHVCIEAGGFGPNRETENAMQGCRGGIEHLAESVGFTTEFVYPATWRSGMGFGTKSKPAKEAAMKLAQEVTGAKDLNEDEAEAICICLWANMQPEKSP